MLRFLFHLLLVASISGSLLGSLGVRTGMILPATTDNRYSTQDRTDDSRHIAAPEQKREELSRHVILFNDAAEEPQMPSLFSSSSSPRILSSRPARLLPSHGGKPQKLGRWGVRNTSNPFNLCLQRMYRTQVGLRASSVSPRLLYVIALRHLLC